MIIFPFSSVLRILYSILDSNVSEVQWITIHKRNSRPTLIFFFSFLPFFLSLLNKYYSFVLRFIFSLFSRSRVDGTRAASMRLFFRPLVMMSWTIVNRTRTFAWSFSTSIYKLYAHKITTITCLPVDFVYPRSLSFLSFSSPSFHTFAASPSTAAIAVVKVYVRVEQKI